MARDSSGTKNEPQYAATGAPADAADLTELGVYAALVGNHKILTATQRAGLTGADRWVGLFVTESDTGDTYQYTSGGWVWVLSLGTYSTVAPNAGWAIASSTGSAIRYRKRGNMVEILPQEYARSSELTVAPGARQDVATLPAGSRPAATSAAGVGSIGVDGNLGASRWFVDTAGVLFFQSLVAGGTMRTVGGVTNHVSHGPLMIQVA